MTKTVYRLEIGIQNLTVGIATFRISFASNDM
jgi:hypothetical protein